MKARERGATVIHVDPRFTRTSAMADLWAPLRAGTDIVFLGAMVEPRARERPGVPRLRRALHERGHDHHARTFRDTEDLDGLFSGFDPATGTYSAETWAYEGSKPRDQQVGHEQVRTGHAKERGADAMKIATPHRDPSLEHPRCVFQILRRHFARYTPELVEETCGVPRDAFIRIADTFCRASGPDRTAAICYAVGWTQHSTGVQIIRTAAILQLLLGNMGRPGGGILALRGHASIQGSTDIPTLYDILPGYLPMPAFGAESRTMGDYLQKHRLETGWWANFDDFLISLLKAWYGDRRQRTTTSASPGCRASAGIIRTSATGSTDGRGKGADRRPVRDGTEPAVGAPNARLERRALANLEWLVVRDLVEIETASFWHDSPEVRRGELQTGDDRHRGVSLSRRRARREGRQLHQHAAAAPVAREGGRSAGRRAQRGLVRLSPRPAAEGNGRRAIRAPPRRPERAHLELPHERRRTASRRSTRCSRRSTAGGRRTAQLIDGLCVARRRRLHRVRLLDLFGRLSRAGPEPGQRTRGRRAATAMAGASPGPPIAASSTTAPRRGPTAARGASARSSSGGTIASANGPASTCPISRGTSRPTIARQMARKATRRSPETRRSSCIPTGWAGSGCRAGSRTARCRRTTSRSNRRSGTALYPPAGQSGADAKRSAGQCLRLLAGRSSVPLRADHVPADRAPHRRRHVAHAPAPRGAAAGALLRDLARAGRRDRRRQRRMGHRRRRRAAPSTHARSSRGACGRCSSTAAPSTRSACPTTWGTRPRHGATSSTTSRDLARSRTCGSWSRRPDCDRPARVERSADEASERADRRFLHRLDGLHRLQGLRGRVQGMERRSRTTGSRSRGLSYDNTRALGHSTWRHVKFVERADPSPAETPPADGGYRSNVFRWDFSSDVCKHCEHAGCLDACPTGLDRPHRVRRRVRPAGRLQRLRLLRRRLSVRRDRPAPRTTAARSSARSATTGRKPASSRRARRRARPNRSVFGEIEELHAARRAAVEELHGRGIDDAVLYDARGHERRRHARDVRRSAERPKLQPAVRAGGAGRPPEGGLAGRRGCGGADGGRHGAGVLRAATGTLRGCPAGGCGIRRRSLGCSRWTGAGQVMATRGISSSGWTPCGARPPSTGESMRPACARRARRCPTATACSLRTTVSRS